MRGGLARDHFRVAGPWALSDEWRKPLRWRGISAAFSRRLRCGITIRAEVARTTIAPVPIVSITFGSLGKRPIRSQSTIGKAVALAILPICKPDPIALTLALIRRPVVIRLRGVRRHAWLHLELRRLLIRRARSLRGRGETIRKRAEIAVVVEIVALAFARRSWLSALSERLCSLCGRNKSKIMFGVLQVILGRYWIAPCVRVSSELQILLRDMMRVSTNLDIRTVRLIRSRQRIGTTPIVCRPATHPLVLTWPHFSFPTSIWLSP
jgi:hypothetical protein